jgi:dienelactone hydrolase
LVIISHGYPGNRFLLSHLGENLASKGYVVVSIDHTDSTYNDQGAFGSTLLNRPLDQLFVLNEMARLNSSDGGTGLKGLVNADLTALIGYSMGGYGVVNTLGGGFTAASVQYPWGTPGEALARRQPGLPGQPGQAHQGGHRHRAVGLEFRLLGRGGPGGHQDTDVLHGGQPG